MKATLFLMILTVLTLGQKRGELLCSIDNRKVSIYFNRIWDDAEAVCKKYNIPMSILLAQSALESGYGMSDLCINKCNYLGIKKNGKYREFSSRKACFEKWAKVLHQNCYINLAPKSFDEWLNALECCNYATSKKYKAKLKWIYNKFNLEIID